MLSRETVRKWVTRFGAHFATCVKRDRPAANDKWHLDEVVIPINGRKFWLWRAVDADGDVLDILVPPQRKRRLRGVSFRDWLVVLVIRVSSLQTSCAVISNRSNL